MRKQAYQANQRSQGELAMNQANQAKQAEQVEQAKRVGGSLVLLIDGQCNLCHAITRFVIRRDPAAKFQFASIQSAVGQQLLRQGHLPGKDLDSFVMIDNGSYYTKSTAALRLCREFGGLWPLLYGLRVIPVWMRNPVYDFIARNRYRWFGHHDRCLMPTEDIRKRFIAESWEAQ
jgi:predicted DCC family thiol-disulfide oxidoreductase YuxK